MTRASHLSPFATIREEEPWILWQEKLPLSHLTTRDKTDCRFENVIRDVEDEPVHIPEAGKMHISRPQYHSVLSRITQASKKASAYSAWSS